MTQDLSHLNAIEQRLIHEATRLANSKTENERVMRQCWVDQVKKELVSERKFLGLEPLSTFDEIMMSDDELLKELMA